MSRIAMNMPKTSAKNAISRRGVTCGSAGVSMAGSPRGVSAPPRRRRRRGVVVRMSARDRDREAGPQPALGGDVGRHGDAHRDALHDLGEVAGGVLRRQQAELRARGRRDALDAAGRRRGRERRRSAGAPAVPRRELGDLGLLEVRLDVDRRQRHHREQPLAGRHEVADRDREVADGAVEGRAQHRRVEVARRLVARGGEAGDRRLGLGLLRVDHRAVGLARSRRRPRPRAPPPRPTRLRRLRPPRAAARSRRRCGRGRW